MRQQIQRKGYYKKEGVWCGLWNSSKGLEREAVVRKQAAMRKCGRCHCKLGTFWVMYRFSSRIRLKVLRNILVPIHSLLRVRPILGIVNSKQYFRMLQ